MHIFALVTNLILPKLDDSPQFDESKDTYDRLLRECSSCDMYKPGGKSNQEFRLKNNDAITGNRNSRQ